MSIEWENVGSKRKSVATAKLAVGASVEGKLVGIEENTNTQYIKKDKDGNVIPAQKLLFEDANGEEFVVYPSGDLNYKIADGKFVPGILYKITRLENGPTKTGNMGSRFLVQAPKGTAEALAAQGSTTSNTKPAGRKGNGANKNA